MSATTPASGAPLPARRFWLIGAVRKVLAATREGIELATRYQMLANMTDEKLAALGVRRKDIARIAVNGWRR